MNEAKHGNMRETIATVFYIISPALSFLVCQYLLNLSFASLLGFALARDEILAISSGVFLPAVVFLYGGGLQFAPSRNRKDLAFAFSVAVAVVLLMSFCLLLDQKREATFLLHLFGFGIAAPIIEEIIYRGYVYERGRSYLRERQAMLLSAILFAAGHHSLGVAVAAFWAGIVFSWALKQTKTLLAPIALHIIWNLISLFS